MLRVSSRLAERADVRHGFTTRHGGVSAGALSSLNLARRPGETDAALRENWGRATAAIGAAEANLALVNQVHDNRVLWVSDGAGPLETVGDADALVSTTPGLVVAVRVADCVPVLLAGPGGVAAVHAGWRGTVARIVPIAVQELCARAGCRPGDLTAAIGPCITLPAYEVGDEVLQRVGALGPGLIQGRHVDLKAANALLLEECGVRDIDVLPGCTVADPALFSHRRDQGETGRQAALIAWCP